MPRIMRVPVYHEGTFWAIISEATRAGVCLSYGGESWEPMEESDEFGLYRKARGSGGLPFIRERVESYELFLYSRLLGERCGADGVLRPRTTQLHRGPNRALRSGRLGSGVGQGARP